MLSLQRRYCLSFYNKMKNSKIMCFQADWAPMPAIVFGMTSLVLTLQLRRGKRKLNSTIIFRHVSSGRDSSNTNAPTTVASTTKEEVQQQRLQHFMKCVSVSYANSGGLMIMQGKGSRLMDETGRSFLDTRNNVCHVGHSHPKVVEAVSKQLAVLNTNTRYLHPNVCKLAERLCAKCPESLQVVVFVNSGSVRCMYAFMRRNSLWTTIVF